MEKKEFPSREEMVRVVTKRYGQDVSDLSLERLEAWYIRATQGEKQNHVSPSEMLGEAAKWREDNLEQ